MTAHIQELRELFRQTLDGLGKMLSLLEKESACLAAREVEAVEATSSRKQKLALLLNDLAARQTLFFQTYGLPSDGGDLNALLDRLGSELPEVPSLQAEWREIVRLTLACRRQNELNGDYIALLRRHVDASLNFLHGALSAGATYGPDGSTRRIAISRQSFSV